MEHLIFKGLMGISLGATFVMLGFMAPSGALLTTSASPEKVERTLGKKPGKHGTRGPRYVFIGYYRGK